MKELTGIKEIKVGLHFGEAIIPVGRLAIRDRIIYFEYDADFIKRGIELSPLHLPLQSGLMRFDRHLFEGLPGVFNDSLPDGWGRLLFDRYARSHNISPSQITPLDRLAHVGVNALGALVYEPDHSDDHSHEPISLDLLARQTRDVLEGEADDVLGTLMALNGSSGGARPKALIGFDNSFTHIVYGAHKLPDGHEPWMVKFAGSQEGHDTGAIEYVYALMATEAGIAMSQVHLFDAKVGAGFFAIKRFDRIEGRRVHMHTACGLLHSDYRTPSLDYQDLMALTSSLTRDVREVEKMYRYAVFNVLAHNRDDHSKNFSFLMDKTGAWRLSPAYDLTFSLGPRGEQSTMVMGEGRHPSVDHLSKLGQEAGLSNERVKEIITQTRGALSKWEELAVQYGVSASSIALIKSKIEIDS
jgi:serine/threonine-protein kinase HipA